MTILKSILSLINGSNPGSAVVDMSYDVNTRYQADYLASKMICRLKVIGTRIDTTYGILEDGYNVADDTIWLTTRTYSGRTAISAAIACHEVGHAYLCKNGFSGSRLDHETNASEVALAFLRGELTTEQYKVAERFLMSALATYER